MMAAASNHIQSSAMTNHNNHDETEEEPMSGGVEMILSIKNNKLPVHKTPVAVGDTGQQQSRRRWSSETQRRRSSGALNQKQGSSHYRRCSDTSLFLKNSLTRQEQELLEATSKYLKQKEEFRMFSFFRRTSKVLVSKRQSLRASMTSKVLVLTQAEQEFLSSLAEATQVSPEQLEQCTNVLELDPLYQDSTSNKYHHRQSRDDDLKGGCSSIEPADAAEVRQQDEEWSFHKAVWKEYYYSDISSNVSVEKKTQQNNKRDSIKRKKLPVSLASWFFPEPTYQEQEEEQEPSQLHDEPKEEIPIVLGIEDPDLIHVLTPPMMDTLRQNLPYAYRQDYFWLKYSMTRDGACIRSMLQNVRTCARTVVAIETTRGEVFGSFTSSPWRPQGTKYYGNGEAFVWRLHKPRLYSIKHVDSERDVDVFHWSGKNYNVQSLARWDSPLIVGGGEPQKDHHDDACKPEEFGPAIMLEPCLSRGTSQMCHTFNSPRLVSQQVFEIANIQVWTMTPVTDVNQAMQLELARQFVFDHGNFCAKPP